MKLATGSFLGSLVSEEFWAPVIHPVRQGGRLERPTYGCAMAKQTHHDELIHVLQQRLHAVADTLQLVAQLCTRGKKSVVHHGEVDSASDDEDSDHAAAPSPTKLVHDLRVNCRRAETALKATRDHLTHKEAAWFRGHLQKIRNSCNALRDDEVFRKWLRQQTASEAQRRLIASLSRDVKAGCRAVAVRARNVIQQQHFRKHVHDLGARTTDGKARPTNARTVWRLELGRWLFQVLNRVIQAVPDDANDLGALHQLRVTVKQLRYGMELVAELDSAASLQGSIGLLHDMQDKLGALHDAVVRLPRLRTEFGDATSEAAELITVALEDLERCVVDWRDWWEFQVLDRVVAECTREAAMLLMPGEA